MTNSDEYMVRLLRCKNKGCDVFSIDSKMILFEDEHKDIKFN